MEHVFFGVFAFYICIHKRQIKDIVDTYILSTYIFFYYVTLALEDYEESIQTDAESSPTYVIFFRSIGEFIGIFGGSFMLGAIIGCLTGKIIFLCTYL